MNTSNFARLKELFRRAAAGQELTIAFLGGSITQGSLSTQPGNAYAFRVYQWFVDTFPQSKFHYVNGGIGGTSSHYGVARAVTDVLMYQPDFVAVDFSVNDLEVPFRQETYEGVVRKLLTWPSHPAVVLLNNIYYDTGETSQDEHNAVGDHYGVPHVSIRDPEQEPAFPAPLTANAYENARRLTIRELSPKLEGFRADPEEKLGHLDHWKNGWIGQKPGDKITFEVDASCIAVQYRKTIRRPALRAQLVLDGDTAHAAVLDGNFDEDWGDCFQCDIIMPHFFRVSIAVVNRFDFLKRQYRCLSWFPDDAIGIRFRFNFQFRVQDFLQGLCAGIIVGSCKAVHISLADFLPVCSESSPAYRESGIQQFQHLAKMNTTTSCGDYSG